MKRLLIVLSLLLLPNVLLGQISIFDDYDLDVATYVYCDPADFPAEMSACATGAAAGDGWVPADRNRNKLIGVFVDTMGVTGGIDVRVEVRMIKQDGSLTSAMVLTTLLNRTAAGAQGVRVPEGYFQVRVGLKIGTADDGGDAIVEDIDVIYSNR